MIGVAWLPDDADVVRRADLTLVAHFMTGHYHFGDWSPAWDPEEYEICPLCGGEYSRAHIVWECERVAEERRAHLGQILDHKGGDLSWLVRFGCLPLGRFLRVVRDLVMRAGVGE